MVNCTASRMAVARGSGRETWALFNGDSISNWEDEKVLEMNSGDVCTTM